MPIENTTTSGSGQPLKEFQLAGDAKSKSDPGFGLRVMRDIQSTLGGNTSYYFIRNARFAKNRSMIAGRYDMSRFMDRLQMNGKLNYLNISWLPFHIVNTIVSRKVGAWMGRKEKIQVNAVDYTSEQLKKEQYEAAEFYLEQREQLMKLQQESGVQMIPQDQMNIQDKDELDIWAQENNRLPEEIKCETGTNALFDEEGLYDVIKEKLLHDSAGVGLLGVYTWMDGKGVIHNEYVKPENQIYSYSEYPDFRDNEWRGRIVSKKISEIRKKYGKEFGGKLTEEEIFALAKTAKQYQIPDKITWTSEWSTSFLRPYDGWNIDVMEIALKSLDSDGFKMKVTGSGTLIMDKSKPFQGAENKEYVEDDGWNMYWGVYAREADKLLEWGVMKNQIKAQDVREIGNVEFPFSFYMYQNQDMRNVAIPEKIEKPFEQMMLILLQMEKLITTWKPPGAMVNVNSVRELDLGLANLMKPLELERHYKQTGNLYYTDTDAEGNKIGTPITEIANAGFQVNAQGLREQYVFWYQVLKDELGEDPNLAMQATQPRVTEGNVQEAVQQADNATDYMYDAYLYVMEEAARKTACLLHDSVSFGAKAYRHILQEEEVESKVFSTRIRMLPTEREVAVLEANINQAVASNPDLVMYMNTFKILRIAKDDIKLAEEYFRLGMKRMLKSKLDQQRENQEATFKAQIESGKAAEQAKGENLAMELDMRNKAIDLQSKADKEKVVLSGVFELAKIMATPKQVSESGKVPKDGEMPPSLKELMELAIRNIAIPMALDNHVMMESISNPQPQEQPMMEEQMQEEQPIQQQQI